MADALHALSRRSLRAPTRALLVSLSLAIAVAIPVAAAAQAVPAALSQKALIEGTVPVIAHLSVLVTPEGLLPDSVMVATQRRGIATGQQSVLSALATSSHRVRHLYQTLPFLALDVDAGALAILNALSGIILRVEEDELSHAALAQSVPLVGGPAVWDIGFTGSGQVVAILDTGVDKTHSFLSGKVVAEACYSGNGNCPNGMRTQVGSGAGVPCTYAINGCRHGTHVAGIAAGLGTSSGVARGAGLMAVQVFSRFTGANCAGAGEDPCTLTFSSDQMKGLERVFLLRTTHSFSSVNMSIGGGAGVTTNCDRDPRKPAIDQLRSVGIATVISSGNDGFTNGMTAPACISTSVSVGSTQDGSFGTTTDAISSFSNSAFFLSLLAPGQWISSSIPGGAFTNAQGTSMAAPHVAGAWAVLKQIKPSATVSEVLATLQTTGLPINDPRNGIIKSRIRLLEAVFALVPPSPGGRKLYTVAPCRIVDTRLAGGMIGANGSRSFDATGSLSGQGGAPNCGVPSGAKAVFINVVVVNPSAAGYLTAHPYPRPVPLASTLNFAAGQTVANGALIPICDSSTTTCPLDFTVTMGLAAGHVVIDVTGYTAAAP